jgi:hypothetical protein
MERSLIWLHLFTFSMPNVFQSVRWALVSKAVFADFLGMNLFLSHDLAFSKMITLLLTKLIFTVIK